MPVDQGGNALDHFDVVIITRGRHAGRMGVYDDDTERGNIVVLPNLYYGAPPNARGGWERLTVRASSVRIATELERARWRRHVRDLDREYTAAWLAAPPIHLKGD